MKKYMAVLIIIFLLSTTNVFGKYSTWKVQRIREKIGKYEQESKYQDAYLLCKDLINSNDLSLEEFQIEIIRFVYLGTIIEINIEDLTPYLKRVQKSDLSEDVLIIYRQRFSQIMQRLFTQNKYSSFTKFLNTYKELDEDIVDKIVLDSSIKNKLIYSLPLSKSDSTILYFRFSNEGDIIGYFTEKYFNTNRVDDFTIYLPSINEPQRSELIEIIFKYYLENNNPSMAEQIIQDNYPTINFNFFGQRLSEYYLNRGDTESSLNFIKKNINEDFALHLINEQSAIELRKKNYTMCSTWLSLLDGYKSNQQICHQLICNAKIGTYTADLESLKKDYFRLRDSLGISYSVIKPYSFREKHVEVWKYPLQVIFENAIPIQKIEELNKISNQNNKLKSLCVTNFYIGLDYYHRGNKTTAQRYFTDAISTGQNDLIEYSLADQYLIQSGEIDLSIDDKLKTIAVLKFEVNGFSEVEANIFSTRLISSLIDLQRFTVLEREKMDEILNEQGFQLSGCTSNECAVEVGQLLGVQLMIAGTIGRFGDLNIIDLRIIDVETGKIVKSSSINIEGGKELLLTRGLNSALMSLMN